MEFYLGNGIDSEPERKFSTATLNTDSGVSSIVNEDTMDDSKEVVFHEVDYRTIRSTSGARVSLDEHRGVHGEMSKLIERKIRHRKSCSLPDILDLDNICNIEQDFDEMNKTNDSSDMNLSFDEPEETSSPRLSKRKFGRGSTLPIQVCGKEHVEEPCFICMKDTEIYCQVCVEVS